ncbi:HlyD family secretion protein [Aminobacter sp. HY435]|uniref:HlyD family secretion protein n=1 Tax=Aminobacter sp. HY435 TaxID=2970917 RepID=UPI0022B9D1AC|nr:HlyD family efflux transporter periplasmic adaptor subunit [Aminobacter sp. HY435]
MSILCSIPFAASLYSACAAPAPLAVGYVEGDYVQLAPIEVAQVENIAVRRGDRVEAGKAIVTLESGDARIAVSQAEAALAQAEAQLADLKVGKRPEEIAALEASVRSTKAQAGEASRVLVRTQDLFKRGIATQAQMDEAKTQVEVSEAAIGLAQANLEVAGLPAREETIKAAQKQVEQSRSALEQAQWRLSKRVLTAPAGGRVTDVIRNAGETASPSAPVVSLLPDGAAKLTLFIPETAFSSIQVGTRLAVRCDGCPEGLTARVSYISPDPEFTPPVIYSLENRQKLVYLVEARPEDANSVLQPGQIVDVALDKSDGE